MPIQIRCSCGKHLAVKDEAAGKRVKCPACGDVRPVPAAAAPVLVQVLAVAEEAPAPLPRARGRIGARAYREGEGLGAHQLTGLCVGWVILLNCVTVGLFTSIWFNLMHGRMPRRRPDDPSAARAFWFLLIPFFNLYWFFFTYLRLITRINEQRALLGLPPSRLHGLVVTFCILHLISAIVFMFVFPPGIYINPVSMVLGCIVFSVIQGRVNELVEASAFAPARGGHKTCPRCAERVKAAATACRFCGQEFVELEADADQRQEEAALIRELRRVVCCNRRRLCLTWGWLLTAIGLAFLGITTPYVLGVNVPPPPDGPDLPARIIGAVFFTVPFLVPGLICLFRAHGYHRELR